MAVTTAAISSAKMIDTQIPSICHISGKTKTDMTWKTMVLKKDIAAETGPLLSAVKNPEPKKDIPENRKEKEDITKPLRVMESRSGYAPAKSIERGRASTSPRITIATEHKMTTVRLFILIFFNSAAFPAP